MLLFKFFLATLYVNVIGMNTLAMLRWHNTRYRIGQKGEFRFRGRGSVALLVDVDLVGDGPSSQATCRPAPLPPTAHEVIITRPSQQHPSPAAEFSYAATPTISQPATPPFHPNYDHRPHQCTPNAATKALEKFHAKIQSELAGPSNSANPQTVKPTTAMKNC